VNALKWGIIDPARCVKNEVSNSVSAASILLTSEVGITAK
jgi:chaperonin GroEL (HSP60 family)